MNIDDYYKITSKHSNKFLKIIEFFFYSYFETISDIMNKYCNPKNELLYFDIDLLIVTNDVLSLKVVEDSLINLVYKRLKLNRKNEVISTNSENSKSLSNKESESNNDSEKNDDFDNKKDDSKIDSSSSISVTSVSKTFLQLETKDILKEIKRKSIQLSSFDSNIFYDGNSEFSEIWNISCIKNTNQNNYDLRSLFSNIPGEKKLSGIDKLSIIEKQDKQDKLDISRRQTDKQINIFKGHRNSIGPTFNIIVNNNNNNNTNNNNGIMASRKVSMKSLKNRRINSIVFNNKNTATIAPNKINFNKKKSSFNFNKASYLHKRSNSSTNSGLYLNQFYSMINNNPKFFKSKYQILREIQNKIKQSYTKKSNSLIIENKKDNKKEKKVKLIKNEKNNNLNKMNSFFEDDQGITNDILQEFYEDKSSVNFLQNNKNSLFKKLNKGK